MFFLDKIKDIFNRISKKKILQLPEQLPDNFLEKIVINNEKEEHIELPEGELVSFSDEVLDTNSKLAIEKFKHNLQLLIAQAKQKKSIDKFIIIREDDLFPEGWEWSALSKYTNLDTVCTKLSVELRKHYALEKSGIKLYMDMNGIKVPFANKEQILEALSKIDKKIGMIKMPSRFRSTKHFTVNTPLGVTGDYNLVKANRNFIVLDDISNFLNSGYAYSIAYHDAYLDISHESLTISKNAVVLINDDKYNEIMKDEKIATQLKMRKVVRFKGDENVAVGMILTELGALPSKVGMVYACYDSETKEILDNGIRKLAEENGLFYNKSHAGRDGHFSNYYDDKNRDYEESMKRFTIFLRKSFPNEQELFLEDLTLSKNIDELINKIGTERLLKVIDEYNEQEENRVSKSLMNYKKDRLNISPKMHQIFVGIVALINDFYRKNGLFVNMENREEIEKEIQTFFQGGSVEEQYEAAKKVYKMLKIREKTIANEHKNISEIGAEGEK